MNLKRLLLPILLITFIITLNPKVSYAAVNDEKMESDLEESLSSFENTFSDRKNWNLDDNDIIKDNLKLSDIYPVYVIDQSKKDLNSANILDHIKETGEYVTTLRLKDSNKAFSIAFIKKNGDKWNIYSGSNYALLDDDINNYKKNVDPNPIIIYDDGARIYAIGSEKNGDKVQIIDPNSFLNQYKGQFETLSNLRTKMKETKNSSNPNLVGGSAGDKTENSDSNESSYFYTIAGTIIVLGAIIGALIYQKSRKVS